VLISEEELERLHKRFRYPRFSKVEYERRYNNIRKLMRESNLDCLLHVDVMAPSTEHIPALIKAGIAGRYNSPVRAAFPGTHTGPTRVLVRLRL
jgi:hypothetical protein